MHPPLGRALEAVKRHANPLCQRAEEPRREIIDEETTTSGFTHGTRLPQNSGTKKKTWQLWIDPVSPFVPGHANKQPRPVKKHLKHPTSTANRIRRYTKPYARLKRIAPRHAPLCLQTQTDTDNRKTMHPHAEGRAEGESIIR